MKVRAVHCSIVSYSACHVLEIVGGGHISWSGKPIGVGDSSCLARFLSREDAISFAEAHNLKVDASC